MLLGTCKVFLTGHVGADGVVRYTPAGTPVLRISIASDNVRGQGASARQATDWHRIVVVGPQAEDRENVVKKGCLCYVQGTLRTRNYGAKGASRLVTEVLVDLNGVFRVYHNCPLNERTREQEQQRPVSQTTTMCGSHSSLSSQHASVSTPRSGKLTPSDLDDEWLSFEGLTLNVYTEPFD